MPKGGQTTTKSSINFWRDKFVHFQLIINVSIWVMTCYFDSGFAGAMILECLGSKYGPWDPTNLIFKSIEKVRPVFFFTFPHIYSLVYFLIRTGQNSDLTAFISKIQVFCRPEWTKGGGRGWAWKWILIISKYKN